MNYEPRTTKSDSGRARTFAQPARGSERLWLQPGNPTTDDKTVYRCSLPVLAGFTAIVIIGPDLRRQCAVQTGLAPN